MRMMNLLFIFVLLLTPRLLSAAAVALPSGKEVLPVEEVFELTAEVPKVLTKTLKADEVSVTYGIESKEIGFQNRDCSLVDESRMDSRWKALANLERRKQKDRAILLQQLVAGLSFREAEFLVQKGFFAEAPRSWNALKAEVKRIDDELASAGAFYELVARAENAAATQSRLGIVIDQCPAKEQVEKMKVVSATKGQKVGTKTATIKISFSGFETAEVTSDRLQLKFDGQNSSLAAVGDNQFIYEIENKSEREFLVRRVARKLIPAEWQAVNLDWVRDPRNRSLKLKFQDSKMSAENPAGRVIVDLELYRARFLKTDDFLVLKQEKVLEGTELVLDLKNEVRRSGNEEWRPGDSYYVLVSFKRTGDPRFSPEPSAPMKTERLEAPR